MLALSYLATVAVSPSIRWYMPGGVNMTDIKANKDIIDGVNYCCGIFEVGDEGNVTTKNTTEVKELNQLYKDLGIDVFLVGSPSENSVLSGKASNAASDIIDYALSTGATGILIDYEPANTYTQHHASMYNAFLKSLKTLAEPKNVQVGMDTASWGILDKFDIYKTSSLDIYTSMSPTYSYNEAVTAKGKQFVTDSHEAYQSAVRYGIGSSATPKSGAHCSFNWTGDHLTPWLAQLPVPAIDIWRCDIDHMGMSDPDFLNALRNWKSQS